jgi:hypothetical protein
MGMRSKGHDAERVCEGADVGVGRTKEAVMDGV